MTRRVVVLGGSGFLGSHICAAFRAAGDTVISVSSSGSGAGGRPLNLVAADPAQLADLADGADVLVNAAGRAWRATDEEMMAANGAFVERLTSTLVATGAKARVVQLGSVHEYGPGTAGTATAEDHPEAPVTGYGISKLRGSRAMLDAARTAGLDAVVLRIANVCGPGAPEGSLLGTIAAQLAAARGSGSCQLRLAPLQARRDFVDVRDVAAAVVAAANASSVPAGQPVNIGRGEAVLVRELVGRLIEISAVRVTVVPAEPAGVARTDVQWQQLDISLAGRLLGWYPAYSIDESLRDQFAVLCHERGSN